MVWRVVSFALRSSGGGSGASMSCSKIKGRVQMGFLSYSCLQRRFGSLDASDALTQQFRRSSKASSTSSSSSHLILVMSDCRKVGSVILHVVVA